MTADESGAKRRPGVEESAQLLDELADEFEVIRKLGEGGMGSVYLAREVALKRLVAIKVPRLQLARDEIVRARFEREAQAAARIHHPAAAAVHRIGRLAEGLPYLVMEYVDGKTLGERIAADGPFPIETGAKLLSEVASALEAAHKQGVIHRDIRPGNVLVEGSTGRAVLSDFGIAGILETGTESITRLTQAGQILGDPAYSSPEQLQGETVTDTTDVYSLGVMGFEILTGERPYVASTRAQLIAAHLRQEPRNLVGILPGVDPRLQDLLERCMAKNPRHRPSAKRVRETLEAIALGPGGATSTGGHEPIPVQGILADFPAVARFVQEVQRRRVGRVGIAYIFIGGAILGAADLILNGMGELEDQVYPIVVTVVLGGFPLTLMLAWMYDLTSVGIQKTESESGSSSPGKVLALQFAGLFASLAVAFLIGWLILG